MKLASSIVLFWFLQQVSSISFNNKFTSQKASSSEHPKVFYFISTKNLKVSPLPEYFVKTLTETVRQSINEHNKNLEQQPGRKAGLGATKAANANDSGGGLSTIIGYVKELFDVLGDFVCNDTGVITNMILELVGFESTMVEVIPLVLEGLCNMGGNEEHEKTCSKIGKKLQSHANGHPETCLELLKSIK